MAWIYLYIRDIINLWIRAKNIMPVRKAKKLEKNIINQNNIKRFLMNITILYKAKLSEKNIINQNNIKRFLMNITILYKAKLSEKNIEIFGTRLKKVENIQCGKLP